MSHRTSSSRARDRQQRPNQEPNQEPNQGPGQQPWTRLVEQRPRLARFALGAPLLLVSLALHGVVLSLTLPGGWQAPEAETEAETTAADSTEANAMPVVRLPAPSPTPLRPTPPAASAPPPAAKAAAAPASSPPAEPPRPAPEETAPEEPPPLPPEPPPQTLQERLLDPTAYAFKPPTGSEATGAAEFVDWYLALLSQPDGADISSGNADLEPLRVQYPLNTCLTPAPVEGRLGVIANPDGTVNRLPEVLSTTGYSILDEQAMATITHYRFPTATGLTAYGLPVVVEYDAANCVPAS